MRLGVRANLNTLLSMPSGEPAMGMTGSGEFSVIRQTNAAKLFRSLQGGATFRQKFLRALAGGIMAVDRA